MVLFFEKGSPTRKVWYYQLSEEKLSRRLGKTNPLNDADLSEFIELQKTFADSEHSWSLDINDVDDATCDPPRSKTPTVTTKSSSALPMPSWMKSLPSMPKVPYIKQHQNPRRLVIMASAEPTAKAGWEYKTLGEMCRIKPPKAEAQRKTEKGNG